MGDAIEYVKVPKKIFEPISDMVKAGMYKDEQEALQRLVHDQAEQKIIATAKRLLKWSRSMGWIFLLLRKESIQEKVKKTLKNGMIL